MPQTARAMRLPSEKLGPVNASGSGVATDIMWKRYVQQDFSSLQKSLRPCCPRPAESRSAPETSESPHHACVESLTAVTSSIAESNSRFQLDHHYRSDQLQRRGFRANYSLGSKLKPERRTRAIPRRRFQSFPDAMAEQTRQPLEMRPISNRRSAFPST